MRARIVWGLSAPLVLGAFALGTTGCSHDQAQVKVVLTEWHVEPTPATISAGAVRFVVKNAGFIGHEVVIVRGDDPETLPTDVNDAVDEARIPPSDKVGKIGDVAPNQTKRATFDLRAGKYILFCNVVDRDNVHAKRGFSHFDERMVNTITVTK